VSEMAGGLQGLEGAGVVLLLEVEFTEFSPGEG